MNRVELTEWHDEPGFVERFDAAALVDVPDTRSFKFEVIRETWDNTVDPPRRIIHEIRVIK